MGSISKPLMQHDSQMVVTVARLSVRVLQVAQKGRKLYTCTEKCGESLLNFFALLLPPPYTNILCVRRQEYTHRERCHDSPSVLKIPSVSQYRSLLEVVRRKLKKKFEKSELIGNLPLHISPFHPTPGGPVRDLPVDSFPRAAPVPMNTCIGHSPAWQSLELAASCL